jgi:hypothetical protein
MEQVGDASQPGAAAGEADPVITGQRPLPAVLELDGYAWRRATPADAPIFEGLAALEPNRILFNLPLSEKEFAVRIGSPTLGQPMVCMHESTPVGAAATTSRNRKSLNLQLVCVFAHPGRAAVPLAVYIRHLFWTMPLHRIYVQMPLVAGADAYVSLLTSVGFVEEGVVRGHALVAGRPVDLKVMGLLRREFEAWCREHESRLSL